MPKLISVKNRLTIQIRKYSRAEPVNSARTTRSPVGATGWPAFSPIELPLLRLSSYMRTVVSLDFARQRGVILHPSSFIPHPSLKRSGLGYPIPLRVIDTDCAELLQCFAQLHQLGYGFYADLPARSVDRSRRFQALLVLVHPPHYVPVDLHQVDAQRLQHFG